jgi:hypothetical protein
MVLVDEETALKQAEKQASLQPSAHLQYASKRNASSCLYSSESGDTNAVVIVATVE